MHQVNQYVIKPLTQNLKQLPGVSYALSKNLATGGLRCAGFLSHAWNEGVYELAENVLKAWPDDVEGVYFCCLSNPQNLDISALLNHKDGSPFARVLCPPTEAEVPKPTTMIMVANRNTPIHSRLWCVLEAYKASENQLERLWIQGSATQLITGAEGEQLKQEELAAKAESVKLEQLALAAYRRSLRETSSEAKTEAEEFRKKVVQQSEETKEKESRMLLGILLKPDEELIDLAAAACSEEADTTRIRNEIKGQEAAITQLIAKLIRDNVCGADLRGGAGGTYVDGPLGKLPLEPPDATLSLKGKDLSRASHVLQLVSWVRSGPKATRLDLQGTKLGKLAEAWPVLAASLSHMGTLGGAVITEVDLSRCDIDPTVAQAIANTLASGSASLTKIS